MFLKNRKIKINYINMPRSKKDISLGIIRMINVIFNYKSSNSKRIWYCLQLIHLIRDLNRIFYLNLKKILAKPLF